MFRNHPCCKLPPDETWIWRYFDFAKFVSLLDSRSLFLPSVDSLEDPLEGAVPWPETERWPRSEAGGGEGTEESPDLRRDLVMVSSWHMNPDESIAMWKLYAKSVEAVAIRSTVGRLKESFREEERFDVHVSQVEYVDHREECPVQNDPLAPFLRKAKPYAYENEVRAIVDLRGREARTGIARQAKRDRGASLRVDLTTLVEGIYISPLAGPWFLSLVRGVLEKYGCPMEPCQSVLAAPASSRGNFPVCNDNAP